MEIKSLLDEIETTKRAIQRQIMCLILTKGMHPLLGWSVQIITLRSEHLQTKSFSLRPSSLSVKYL